ncbi:MAG: class I SAM-dependent methyltransferase [Ferruginibacter sp.]|nr:class I SAM-dependent methyltransferase [Ferruginibacter sp.]
MDLLNNCLFCESSRVEDDTRLPIFYNGTLFTWKKCKKCSLVFIGPPLSNDDTQKLYAPSAYHDEYYFKYTEGYTAQLKAIKPYKQKTVLDFGCGDAGLLNFLQTNNYTVTGVEYDNGLVEKLTAKFSSINFIQEKDFWDTTYTFDIIHLGDVLEHVSHPIKLVQQLREKLNPDGIFFIEGPLECNPSLGYYFRKLTYAIKKTINKESLRVQEPYHITYSNATNQQLFFERLKLKKQVFKVVEAGWPYIDTIAEVKSPWLFLQYLIAKTSKFTSYLVPNWGNRFVYIGKL